jgi:ubiquitin related modifier 1
MSPTLDLKIEFGGGLELLFGNVRSHKIALPAHADTDTDTDIDTDGTHKPADLAFLIRWLRENLLKERAELFVEHGTVYVFNLFVRAIGGALTMGGAHSRPGILVLVNDTDWELEGEGDYELKTGDEIVFISTLHGG